MRLSSWGCALAFAMVGCVSHDGPAGLPPPSVQEAADAGAPASGFGTAVVDGVIGDEWAGAATFPLYDDAGQPVAGAWFLIMNDMENVYVGLTLPDQPDEDRFEVRFDNDADGVLEEDEDELIVLGPGVVTDQPLIDGNANLGDYCCWGYWDTQQDGGGAVGVSESGVSYEAWHPLSSGDPQDFALAPGAVVGVCALYYDAPAFVLRHSPARCGYGGTDLSGFLRFPISAPSAADVLSELVEGVRTLIADGRLAGPSGRGLLPLVESADARLAADDPQACRSLIGAFLARLAAAETAGQVSEADAAELRALANLVLAAL